MNKLILIGNGFDLAHGLETRYSNFILWYLNKSLRQFNLTHPHYYKDDLITLSQGYYAINKQEFKSIQDFQDTIHNRNLAITYSNKFVQGIISDSIEYGWVDIEAKYYSALVSLYKRLEKVDLDRHPDITRELDNLNTSFNSIKRELAEYLLPIDKQTKKINEEIDQHFLKEFRDKSATGLDRRRKKNNILILNFNYTSTIEIYKARYSQIHFTINYIHGKLEDLNNPIIFGYGDEMHKYYDKIEQLDSDDFLMNIKSFGYFKTKNYQNFIGFIDSEAFEVSIMGHSCGLSDRILLNSIFEHVNCKSINIFYHQKSNLNNDYFEKTQKISRHFKASTKGEMRKRIVPYADSVPLVKFKA
jgi:hypothetical protein